MMKSTDDYSAKLRWWANHPQVIALPKVVSLPRFRAQKFRSYAEMNQWKRELLRQLARAGGCRWTR